MFIEAIRELLSSSSTQSDDVKRVEFIGKHGVYYARGRDNA